MDGSNAVHLNTPATSTIRQQPASRSTFTPLVELGLWCFEHWESCFVIAAESRYLPEQHDEKQTLLSIE
jgi:hypothetical protein